MKNRYYVLVNKRVFIGIPLEIEALNKEEAKNKAIGLAKKSDLKNAIYHEVYEIQEVIDINNPKRIKDD